MVHNELRELQACAHASYVVRPYYSTRGFLTQILTPEDGDLSVATALIYRRIPAPHELLPYPRARSGAFTTVIAALNRHLPITAPALLSVGTAAIIDTGQRLPGIDILPEPMRWGEQQPFEERHPLHWRTRNLPSGTRLAPVLLATPDRDYFAPLAIDPIAAARVLTPALLAYTRKSGVAWWSEGTTLFTWTHDALPIRMRPGLAECAQRIHQFLIAESERESNRKQS